MSAFILLWCALSLVAAGLVKGVVGIAMPMVAISLLSLVVPLRFAVLLLPIPMLVTNVWQGVSSGYFRYALRRFWLLLVAMCVGTFIGANTFATIDRDLLNALVGVVVILFSLTLSGMPRISLRPRTESWLGVLAGGLGGMLGGISTLFGPPIVIFLATLGLPKDSFVGCITTIYLFC